MLATRAARTAFGYVYVYVYGSGGQESYPLRIFSLGRSGQSAADGGRSSAAPVSSEGVQPGVRPDVQAARVSSAAPKKEII